MCVVVGSRMQLEVGGRVAQDGRYSGCAVIANYNKNKDFRAQWDRSVVVSQGGVLFEM